MKDKLETILLVDDDPISNYISEELIRGKGLCNNVITVTDGRQALDYLEKMLLEVSEKQSLLVLLDLNMPVMDGFEFMEELQARQLHQRVIVAVLSSSDNHKDIQLAGNYSFAAYLQKPLSVEEVSALVEKIFC